MSFLSLGLKNDETQAGSEQSSANGNGHEPSGLLGLSAPRNGDGRAGNSNGNHSAASVMNGALDIDKHKDTKDTGVAETVQREVTRTLADKRASGESTVKPRFGAIDARNDDARNETAQTEDYTDGDDEERNALPPAIEALRRKLAGKGYKPQFRRV